MNEQQTTDTTNVQTTEQTTDTSANTATTTDQAGGTGQEQPNGAEQQQEQAQTETPDVPESADAYAIQLEGFDFDSFKTDNAEVLKAFHAEGMTNKQVEAVVKAYDQHMQVNLEALQSEWGAEYQANVNLANQAIQALGFKPEDLDSPTAVIKLAAAIGKHIQEDLPANNTQQSGGESIEQLMLSEAYSNASHPDHKSVAARVSEYFQKNFPE
jgi:hypothetical protein